MHLSSGTRAIYALSVQIQDRRRAVRHRKLLRFEFDYDDKHVTCVSTDISRWGTFVNSQVVPLVGCALELIYRPSEDARETILLRSRVIRIVHQTLRASRIPGLAVAFEEVASVGGKRALLQFMAGTLGIPESEADDESFHTDDAGYAVFAIAGRDETSDSRAPYARLEHERTLPLGQQASEAALDQLQQRKERRHNPRFPVNVDVSFYIGDIPYLGSVENISRTSLYIRTDHDLPAMGTNLTLKYPLAEAPDPQYVRIDGTVCRHWNESTERPQGFAIHFDHVGELGRPGLFHTYLRYSMRPR